MAKRAAEKPLSEVIRERRATPSFESIPIHEVDLKKILEAGLSAPSGYNLQPWHFVVVRDPEQRKRLREAAMDQAKVEEAPVVIVACGDKDGWRKGDLEEVLRIGAQQGFTDPARQEKTRQAVTSLLGGAPGDLGGIAPDLAVWVNRHVMIAFTHMMLMAEALGYDTAPMEGFHESKVKALLKIPESVRVVALLAIGKLKGPDKRYGGRFSIGRIVFAEEWGTALMIA
jgi:nitroreductase